MVRLMGFGGAIKKFYIVLIDGLDNNMVGGKDRKNKKMIKFFLKHFKTI
jgi:hypothetical protein